MLRFNMFQRVAWSDSSKKLLALSESLGLPAPRKGSYASWKTDARLTQVEPAVATKRSSPDGAAVTSLGEVAVRLKVMFKMFKKRQVMWRNANGRFLHTLAICSQVMCLRAVEVTWLLLDGSPAEPVAQSAGTRAGSLPCCKPKPWRSHQI